MKKPHVFFLREQHSLFALLFPILVDQFLDMNGRDCSDAFQLLSRRALRRFLEFTVDNDPL